MSRFFKQTIPATAGNVLYNIRPDGSFPNLRWKIHKMRITLVADANVANRIIRFHQYDDSGLSNEMDAAMSCSTAVTAGQTKSVSMGTVRPTATFTMIDLGRLEQDIPLVLDRAMTLSIEIVNGVAGDSFSGFVIIEEEPSGSAQP